MAPSAVQILQLLERYESLRQDADTSLQKCVWELTKARRLHSAHSLTASQVRPELRPQRVVLSDGTLVNPESVPPELQTERITTGLRQRKNVVPQQRHEKSWEAAPGAVRDPRVLLGGTPRTLGPSQTAAKESLQQYCEIAQIVVELNQLLSK